MNIPPFIDSQLSFFLKECDEICHLGRNEWFEFVALWKCLHVLEENYCRIYIFYWEDNLLLKSEDSSMIIFKLFSVIEWNDGYIRLNITINPSNMRWGANGEVWIELSILIFNEHEFYKPVVLRYHRRF